MQKEIEVWKDVNDYQGMYKISSFGNVKSIDRTIIDNSHNKRTRLFKGVPLRKRINKQGYYAVNLTKHNKKKTFKVHQMVAIHFLGHIQCGFIRVVDHKDGNSLNNIHTNLRIVSQRQNTHNQSKKYTSKYIGVSYAKKKNKWYANIRINGKSKNLGYYHDEYEAHLVYQKALSELS